jgi:hypothetical protein
MDTIRSARIALLAIFMSTAGIGNAVAATPEQLAEIQKPVEQVFEAPGHTKEQIYGAAKIWIAETFRSAKAVIEYDNEDEGTIIGNGLMQYPCRGFECLAKSDWKVRFTIRIDTKDDKFRLTFSNVNLVWAASYGSGIATPAHDGPIYSNKDREKIGAALLAFGPQLAGAVEQGKTNDDW